MNMEAVQQYMNMREKYGIKPGLERIQALLQYTNHPEKKLQTVHVAGTNGKGSTIQLMQTVLQKEGYTVGIFSSPSFTGLCGHIVINGEEISETNFIQLLERLMPAIEKLDEAENYPTPFEILTVIAFLYFQDRTDIVFVETGMGGKDDTTNVVEPILSVITSIAKDHTQFLGNTMTEIARHKAGIIKNNIPVIVGQVNEDAKEVIFAKCLEENASLYLLGRDFSFQSPNILLDRESYLVSDPYASTYQAYNFAVATMALTYLQQAGWTVHKRTIENAIQHFQMEGRLERVWNNPVLILDSAHNVASIQALCRYVQTTFPHQSVHVLFSAFRDKDVDMMLHLLEEANMYVTTTTFTHHRAMSKEDWETYHLSFVPKWQKYIKEKLQHSTSDDVYIITGSMHFIMQVRPFIKSLSTE